MAALLTKSSATGKTPLRRGFSLYAFDIYIGGVHYEADPAKDARNLAKHGVGFDEAASCLLDPMALAMRDDAEGEHRWVLGLQ